MWYIFVAIFILFLLSWIAYGYFAVRSVEQLSYQVLEKKEGYEIREIPTHLVARTQISGAFRESGDQAFRILAGYIFGGNTSQQSIAMTTPVVNQSGSQKIAMTTPVINSEKDGYYEFVLPSKYRLEDLPRPNDSRVELVEVPRKKVAVLQFSGFFSDARFEKKKLELLAKLNRDGLNYTNLYSAGYSPPLTPPFMTRLEVWAELEK